jgi:hypothetical protein
MHPLEPPALSPEAIFDAAVSTIQNKVKKVRFSKESANVAKAGLDYANALSRQTVATLKESDFLLATVTSAEMGRVYEYRLRNLESPNRHYYDDLKNAPDHLSCPYCGQRLVETLDHYLPQSSFSALNVTPSNLVPACTDCNKFKLSYKPDASLPALLHPYFDRVDHIPWLQATISPSTPPKVTYWVDQAVFPSLALATRVVKHFDVFGLQKLYGSHGGQRLNTLESRLPDIFANGGAASVRSYLLDESRALSARASNTWERVLHLELADNTWYCESHFAR